MVDLINIRIEVSEQIYNATLQILVTEMDMTESNNTAYANMYCFRKLAKRTVMFNIQHMILLATNLTVTQNNASANVDLIDTVKGDVYQI